MRRDSYKSYRTNHTLKNNGHRCNTSNERVEPDNPTRHKCEDNCENKNKCVPCGL